MEKEFVTYEIALKLKELGFNEPCFGYYHINEGYTLGYAFCYSEKGMNSECSVAAPLWQQVIDWLREVNNFDIDISRIHKRNDWYHFSINYVWEFFQGTYYEARKKAIEMCLEKIKMK